MSHTTPMLDGKEQPSVTQVTKLLAKPWLIHFGIKACAEEAVKNREADVDQLKKLARARCQVIREDATDLGKHLHDVVEQFVKGIITAEQAVKMGYTAEEGQILYSFTNLWHELGYEMEATEEHFVYPFSFKWYGQEVSLPYGGTLDLRVKDKNGVRRIIDYKFADNESEEWPYQLGGYAGLVATQYDPIEHGEIWMFSKKEPGKVKRIQWSMLHSINFKYGFIPLRMVYEFEKIQQRSLA